MNKIMIFAFSHFQIFSKGLKGTDPLSDFQHVGKSISNLITAWCSSAMLPWKK